MRRPIKRSQMQQSYLTKSVNSLYTAAQRFHERDVQVQYRAQLFYYYY